MVIVGRVTAWHVPSAFPTFSWASCSRLAARLSLASKPAHRRPRATERPTTSLSAPPRFRQLSTTAFW